MYVPSVGHKSISPVDAFMLRPAVELNVPPVVPVIVGVGSVPDTQYSLDAYENVPSSLSVTITPSSVSVQPL